MSYLANQTVKDSAIKQHGLFFKDKNVWLFILNEDNTKSSICNATNPFQDLWEVSSSCQL